MFDQDLVTRYYAYNAFFFFFQDWQNLEPGVFGNETIAPSDQTKIYEDETYGMNSQFKLCYWVRAADPDNIYRMEDAKFLQIYFKTKSVNITNEAMDNIVGPKSSLRMIINYLRETIL